MIPSKKLCDKYVGVPYEHHGRTIKGLDCWGLIVMAYKDLGIDVIDLENYEFNWARHGKNHFLENYHEAWRKVMYPKFMDVLLFKNHEGVVNHAGIYLGYGKFLQCAYKVGVVVTPLDGKWSTRLVSSFRYLEDITKEKE
jgi:cell wall-associated NlpC family hydrolase